MSGLLKQMRLLNEDHTPDGWPAVRMSEINELINMIEQLAQRCAELEQIADTAFKYNHSSAQCLRAWNKLEQLRKEQNDV